MTGTLASRLRAPVNRGPSRDPDEALHEPASGPVDGDPLGAGRPVADAHRGVDRQHPRRMAEPHVAVHGRDALADDGTLDACGEGTVVRECVASVNGDVRLGHASGVLPIDAAVSVRDGAPRAERVTVYRTARRLMEGFVRIP